MSSRRWRWVAAYLLLLAASHAARLARPMPPKEGDAQLAVPEVDGDRLTGREVRISLLDRGPLPPVDAAPRLPVVLIHGSPGNKHNFDAVLPGLAADRRVLVPDLPGFGTSTLDVADYSIHAHARYVLEMLDELGIGAAHFVGFSLGGAVALEVQNLAPKRVSSLGLVAATGVQELELLGDYRLNHAVHGLQLGALWLLSEAVPHFGWLDDTLFGVPYARNFFDSDQRPLRRILAEYTGPMLIVHGRSDVLVPLAAALEHHRLVPQSELLLLDANHFFVFRRGPEVARRLDAFLDRVESGGATTRAEAGVARKVEAAKPFDPSRWPHFDGFSLLVVMVALAAATLVSEDLTCIAAGLLVGAGRLGLASAVLACTVGIYAGDLLLFAGGRLLGSRALGRRPFSWFLQPEDVERSRRWFERRGAVIILLSRFLPGTRLATYFTAGLLGTRFWRFSFFFLLAVLLWTPLLVGLAAWVGTGVQELLSAFERYAWLGIVLAALAVLAVTRLLLPALTYRGRRLLRGRLRRLVRWEYWPPWVFYPPVVLWILWLGLRHRCLTLFTASNPAIPASGFIGESKSRILQGLHGADGLVARHRLLHSCLPPEERMERAHAFLAEHELELPVVLKPDAGQRGSGVRVVRSAEELAAVLEAADEDLILQEYAAGAEFGVFYVRLPHEPRGRIFSVTEKILPEIEGDGRRTVEELILGDPALLAMAPHYLRVQSERLEEVPAAGERRRLVDLGTHCRGAVFLDGRRVVTAELEAALDRISRRLGGFFFGRYDLRTTSLEALRQGTGFRILELNGVTSEATHIYDPGNSLLTAYRVLFDQWSLAFEIGRQNVARGARPVPAGELLRLLRDFRRGVRGSTAPPEPDPAAPPQPEAAAGPDCRLSDR